MQIELDITQRRIVLQGLWKEIDMYQEMLNNTKDTMVAKHCMNCINAIMELEQILLGVKK
jgi:hypothetical protein